MGLLKVVTYPSPVLQTKAAPLKSVSSDERKLIRDMIETMYQEDGVGIAAPQVGVSKRIIIISPNAKKGEERALINPEIIEFSKEKELGSEGCLSLPGLSCDIMRSKKIKVKSKDVDGRERIEEYQNFPARVIQHEIDHLDGVLMIDRVNPNQKQAALNEYQRF